MTHMFNVFEKKLIDYAGMFPPTQLPLDEAIRNYAAYIRTDDAWMINTFVVPFSHIDQLASYASLYSTTYPLRLSVTLGKSDTYSETKSQLDDVRQTLQNLVTHYHWLSVDALEIPINTLIFNHPVLEDIWGLSLTLEAEVFMEIQTIGLDNFEQHIVQMLEAVKSFNDRHDATLKVKLRTGHVDPALVPTTAQIAYFIQQVHRFGLAMKFTAGLHHPIRMYRDEIQDKMHGHLNVFVAGFLASHFDLPHQVIQAILEEEDMENFTFTDQSLGWQSYIVTQADVQNERLTHFNSFGSCSFTTPTSELQALIQ
ncbi:TPA: hypothetical protein ACUI23_001765 [Staphylococcus pseudintermedius]